ncbi:MAG: RNA 2',3'-cyclic phosphodiesterase [Woeseiaceae bacterium]|nr:RNA 2',3'-cyclic phosphodiesterase [Woeseiaceae bacterium]
MAEKTLFYALWPSERQREVMRDIINPAVSEVEGVAVDRRNWHITLVYIGVFDEDNIPALQAAASNIAPFDFRLRFDRISFWQRPKIASMNPRNTPAELTALVKSLEDILKPFGFVPNERVYRPHITVARRARSFTEVPLARPLDLEWSSFELVESVPTTRGVQYHPIKQ